MGRGRRNKVYLNPEQRQKLESIATAKAIRTNDILDE